MYMTCMRVSYYCFPSENQNVHRMNDEASELLWLQVSLLFDEEMCDVDDRLLLTRTRTQ